MDHPHMVIVDAAALCIHQLLAAYLIIFDDVPTASKARVKRHKHKLTPYKRNLLVTYAWPTTNLEHVSHLECILQDINRPYMKDVTHHHRW
jgi:hypothetical protein